MLKQQFDESDVELNSTRIVYHGYFKIAKLCFRHRLFAGGWSNTVERELFERGHAAAVLAYDPDANAVVLLEQFRVGALAAGDSPWQLEIVAGIIENGLSAEQTAHKEAKEEAGLQLKSLQQIMRYFPSPGGSSETIALYLGIVDITTAHGIHGVAEEDEDILVHVVPLPEALTLVQNGVISNAASIIALQWLALNKAQLFDK
ncbi:MAG: NUDIX domain-containing protein [Enterovibrio sp.]